MLDYTEDEKREIAEAKAAREFREKHCLFWVVTSGHKVMAELGYVTEAASVNNPDGIPPGFYDLYIVAKDDVWPLIELLAENGIFRAHAV